MFMMLLRCNRNAGYKYEIFKHGKKTTSQTSGGGEQDQEREDKVCSFLG